ncbi:MAG TPA: restriction endonuclease subunit S, partial [Candidatus Dojkabacteria bacterium]|nr:restriction endonuclease subunit S [Candidatus Dojkabacteria bacterium]
YVDSDCTSANLEWLRYLLESLRLDRYSKDSAVPGLAREDAYVYRATYPPTIEEQKRIVEHIKTETKTLDIAISKAEREIELIKEYREAMIVEAVTGKIL